MPIQCFNLAKTSSSNHTWTSKLFGYVLKYIRQPWEYLHAQATILCVVYNWRFHTCVHGTCFTSVQFYHFIMLAHCLWAGYKRCGMVAKHPHQQHKRRNMQCKYFFQNRDKYFEVQHIALLFIQETYDDNVSCRRNADNQKHNYTGRTLECFDMLTLESRMNGVQQNIPQYLGRNTILTSSKRNDDISFYGEVALHMTLVCGHFLDHLCQITYKTSRDFLGLCSLKRQLYSKVIRVKKSRSGEPS